MHVIFSVVKKLKEKTGNLVQNLPCCQFVDRQTDKTLRKAVTRFMARIIASQSQSTDS